MYFTLLDMILNRVKQQKNNYSKQMKVFIRLLEDKRGGLTVINAPAPSPDLNPIEYLLEALEKQ